MISAAGRVKAIEALRLRDRGNEDELPPGLGADAKTYDEWFEIATPTYQVEGHHGGNRWQRAVYKMLGHEIFIETCFPWNIFKENTERAMVPGFDVRAGDPVIELAGQNGGRWMPGYYAEDGFGWPVWSDGGDQEVDVARLCWDFLTKYNASKGTKA